MRRAAILGLVFAGSLAGVLEAVEPPAGTPRTPSTQPMAMPVELPSVETVQRTIRQLNHPLPGRRREAVRQLSLWGPLAFESLGRTAAGPDLESALLARDLLAEMGEVLFVGAQVHIEVDRTRIRWDEPIVLTIRVDNPTAGDVRVSWPTDGAAGDAQGAADDATQVAALMDVADFLAVSAPSGESVELRVDPIEQDTAVHRVVSVRAGAAPPSQVIPPGGSARLTVPQWNRGWARFPTLGRGTYSIRFEYQPPWKDAAWIAQGVGAVLSNTVQIEVVEPAPPSIQQATRPMELRLREEHHQIIGELRNLWDRELYINLNMGGPLETHARLEWCPAADAGEAGPFTLEGDATGRDFAPERLKVLAPGETARVADSAVALLLKQARSPSAGDGEPVEVALRYVHLATPDALRRSLRQKGRRESIPTQVFSGAVLSPGIRLVPDP